MAEAYLTQEDMTRYLDRSICRYDGLPVYVSCSQKFPMISIYKLDGRLGLAWMVIDHKDEKFCDRQPPLGYINWERNAFYLQNMPIRNQRAGLRANTIIALGAGYTGNSFTSTAMENCILGVHPKIGAAWQQLREAGFQGVAIHRNLAICSVSSRNHGLHYKGRLVALWSNPAERWEYLQGPDTSHLERIISKLGVL